jgi:hypothetical protein
MSLLDRSLASLVARIRRRARDGAIAAIHVEPMRGHWVVRDDGETEPRSVHGDVAAATRAAREHADSLGHVRVLLRDRYGRVHEIVAPGHEDDR